MARLALTSGSYSARSAIANCQRRVNYYPEINPKDSPAPVTHYQRPGLRPLCAPAVAAPGRGLYRASNGQGYAVIGSGVYRVYPNWVLTKLGDLNSPGTNLVSMTDNGINVLLVDNSNQGYTWTLADDVFAAVVDPTGLFAGATKVDTIDTFILSNVIGTSEFISSLSNEISWDPTYIASKSNYPDPLQTLVVNRHEILLIGQLKSEQWYDAGNPAFPFAELPGAYIEHGTCAPYSVASADINVYWLGQDLQGIGQVYRQRGYECRKITTPAIVLAFEQMLATGVSLTDAIGYTYQQGDHLFYVLTFPSGDQTWVYDEASELWHQRAWTDADGLLHRERVNSYAFLHDTNVGIDWENGTLYALDQQIFTDTVATVLYPMTCIATFPHLISGIDPKTGQLSVADGKRVKHKQFIADIEVGNSTSVAAAGVQVLLRYSDDRGKTFSGQILLAMGEEGQFLTQPQVKPLGIARDRVYELQLSVNGQAALNGAWVEAEILDS